MKWTPSPPGIVRIFDDIMSTLPQAGRRKMFGYPAAFANGHMIAGLHQQSFILRLSNEDYVAFLEVRGAKPFEPMPGRAMSGFVVVPERMLNSADLRPWLQKALAHALSLPPKATKTRTATRAKRTG